MAQINEIGYADRQDIGIRRQVPPTVRLFQEIGYLFIRGLKQSLRPLPALIPSLFMPAFFLVVSSAAFQSMASSMNITHGSYLTFYGPVAILQSIFFSSGDAGIDLVVDITSGYFDKLMIAPIHHIAIVLGKLMAVGLRAAVQSSIVICLYILMGGPLVTGFAGYLLIILLGAFFGMAWSGLGMTIALRTKNQRTTQSAFILFFPFTFITTAQLPLEYLHGWYRHAVELNPATYILEAIRTLTSRGWDWTLIGHGFIAAAGVAVVTITATMLSFRSATR